MKKDTTIGWCCYTHISCTDEIANVFITQVCIAVHHCIFPNEVKEGNFKLSSRILVLIGKQNLKIYILAIYQLMCISAR